MPFLRFQELGDVGSADLHFERGGHSVERLDALAGEILGVLMQIDEAGRDDQSLGVNNAASVECARRNLCDLSITDADAADCVEARFRIHYSSAFKNQVV